MGERRLRNWSPAQARLAIGRAATVYFVEGASLRDARRAFRAKTRKSESRCRARNQKTLREPAEL